MQSQQTTDTTVKENEMKDDEKEKEDERNMKDEGDIKDYVDTTAE